jgi:hypothetical protein
LIGTYNNNATASDESVDVFIDEVIIVEADPPFKPYPPLRIERGG